MASVTIELTDEEAARLRERATALALSPEALAAAIVRGELDDDDAFERLARRVVDRNRELYARLA